MTHQGLLETKLEYWIAKYEKDTEEKARELDVLKSSKAKDLERLQELTKLVCCQSCVFLFTSICIKLYFGNTIKVTVKSQIT